MKPMTGEMGKLSIDGQQVGGFKYWTAIQNRDTLQCHVVASKFWVLKKVATNNMKAEFYAFDFNDNLELIYQADATVDFPEYVLDRMISRKLDIDLGEFDWLQGLGR